MAKSRLDLHEILVDILGSRNVYFQPPESVKLQYPCIVYERSNYFVNSADNIDYRVLKEYTITVIDKNPDSEIPDKVARLPYCNYRPGGHFVVDNLNHDVFTLYY